MACYVLGALILGFGLACAARADGAAPAAAIAALADALLEEGDARAARVERRRAELLSAPATPPREAPPSSAAARTWPPGALPVRAMVGFYRAFIGPALGHRCILDPSCSNYALQAARERGWLGLPMTADRLIREPSVIAARERIVTNAQGGVRIADPVSDHIGARRPRAEPAKETCEHAHH